MVFTFKKKCDTMKEKKRKEDIMMAKKLISCILVLAMVIMLAVGCSDPVDQTDEQNDETTPSAADTSGAGGDVTEPPANDNLDENGYIKDDIPGDTDLEKETVTFLYWEDASNIEFFAEDQNGEGVNDALYARNISVEDRLNVELIFVPSLGKYEEQDEFLSKVTNDITSGLREFDVLASYSMTIASASYMGYAQDMRQFDVLDFDKPWWPDNLLKESTIYDKLYFASGDISTNFLYLMYCCFFNKKMLEDHGLESPYDLVDKNQWTLDKMIAMSENIYRDNNGNNTVDDEDTFAFNVRSNVYLDPFYYGSGLTTMDKNSDGVPVVSDDFASEKAADLVSKVRSYLLDGNYAQITNMNVFLGGRALFSYNTVQLASKELQESDFDFGLVPVPKYDSAQENFSTVLGFPYTLYCISSGSQNSENAAIVLECMASEGYRQVTPVLFEVCMKYKYASDDKTSQMYDILRETTSFDIGRLFTMNFNKITFQHFRKCVDGTSNTEYLTSVRSQVKMLERLVTKFAETFEAMD